MGRAVGDGGRRAVHLLGGATPNPHPNPHPRPHPNPHPHPNPNPNPNPNPSPNPNPDQELPYDNLLDQHRSGVLERTEQCPVLTVASPNPNPNPNPSPNPTLTRTRIRTRTRTLTLTRWRRCRVPTRPPRSGTSRSARGRPRGPCTCRRGGARCPARSSRRSRWASTSTTSSTRTRAWRTCRS